MVYVYIMYLIIYCEIHFSYRCIFLIKPLFEILKCYSLFVICQQCRNNHDNVIFIFKSILNLSNKCCILFYPIIASTYVLFSFYSFIEHAVNCTVYKILKTPQQTDHLKKRNYIDFLYTNSKKVTLTGFYQFLRFCACRYFL